MTNVNQAKALIAHDLCDAMDALILGANPALVASPSSPSVSTKGFDPGEAEVAVDLAARQIAIDADFLTVAPKQLVRANRGLIEEARERLNDALARIGA